LRAGGRSAITVIPTNLRTEEHMTTDVEVKKAERPLSRFWEWFDQPDLSRFFEGLRPFDERMRIEEEMVDDELVIRAEIPGVDPDKDIDITVQDGRLMLRAERRKEETTKTDVGYRTEFRYGSFHRSLPLPKGCSGKDVTATYRDGILEVRMPMPKSTAEAVDKITVSRG
jgi:HSP20 family protein